MPNMYNTRQMQGFAPVDTTGLDLLSNTLNKFVDNDFRNSLARQKQQREETRRQALQSLANQVGEIDQLSTYQARNTARDKAIINFANATEDYSSVATALGRRETEPRSTWRESSPFPAIDPIDQKQKMYVRRQNTITGDYETVPLDLGGVRELPSERKTREEENIQLREKAKGTKPPASLKTAEVNKTKAEEYLKTNYKGVDLSGILRGNVNAETLTRLRLKANPSLNHDKVLTDADKAIKTYQNAWNGLYGHPDAEKNGYINPLKGGGPPPEAPVTGKRKIKLSDYKADPRNNTTGYSDEEVKAHLEQSGYEVE